MKKTSLWELFFTFFKIGLFTFGGGLAMISIIEKEVVAKKGWATDSDMLDMIIIAESTPGVLAVNTATSVGYKTRGVLGSLFATLGVVLPSFCIIFALSFLIDAFQNNKWYQSAFYGIQVSVCILIICAFVKMFNQLQNNVFNYIMMLISLGIALFTGISVIYVIIAGAVVGIVYSLIKDKCGKKAVAISDNMLEQNKENFDSVDSQCKENCTSTTDEDNNFVDAQKQDNHTDSSVEECSIKDCQSNIKQNVNTDVDNNGDEHLSSQENSHKGDR